MHTYVFLMLCWGTALASQLTRINNDGVVYASAPQERGAYAVGGQGGVFNYGYNTGDGIAKVEVRRGDGSVIGSYRYFDPNGKQVVRSYIADSKGFRVLGNDMPIDHQAPAAQVAGAPALTAPYEGISGLSYKDSSLQQVVYETGPSTSNLQPQVAEAERVAATDQEQLRKHQQEYQKQLDILKNQQNQVEELSKRLTAQGKEFTNFSQRQQPQTVFQQTQQMVPRQLPQTVFQQNLILPQEKQPSYSTNLAQLSHSKNLAQAGRFSSPYFLYQDNINFDFPAGFAYAGLSVVVPKIQPVGEIRDVPQTSLFSGHTHSDNPGNPPIAPLKNFNDPTAFEITSGHTKFNIPAKPPIAPLKTFIAPAFEITSGHTQHAYKPLLVAPLKNKNYSSGGRQYILGHSRK